MQRLQDYVTFDKNGQRLKTFTFSIPQAFYQALASDLGRKGDTASDPETEAYIREVVRANIEHVIEENRPKTRLRIPRRATFKIRRAPSS